MKAIVAIFLWGFSLLPAARAGVDGQWEAAASDGRSGVLLELKSDDGRLIGSCSPMAD